LRQIRMTTLLLTNVATADYVCRGSRSVSTAPQLVRKPPRSSIRGLWVNEREIVRKPKLLCMFSTNARPRYRSYVHSWLALFTGRGRYIGVFEQKALFESWKLCLNCNRP